MRLDPVGQGELQGLVVRHNERVDPLTSVLVGEIGPEGGNPGFVGEALPVQVLDLGHVVGVDAAQDAQDPGHLLVGPVEGLVIGVQNHYRFPRQGRAGSLARRRPEEAAQDRGPSQADGAKGAEDILKYGHGCPCHRVIAKTFKASSP
jgi:hypothetical protein